MNELPPELAALSQATGEDEKRRARETAIAIVALVERGRLDAVVGALVASALALVAWRVSGRWLVGGVALCALFPLAARASRRVRLAWLRRAFTRNQDHAWRSAAIAWQSATPGQRAALMRIALGQRIP
jgi:hypothetical protein